MSLTINHKNLLARKKQQTVNTKRIYGHRKYNRLLVLKGFKSNIALRMKDDSYVKPTDHDTVHQMID